MFGPGPPQLGDSGFEIGNPSSDNVNGATIVPPPTLLPSEFRQARREAADTFRRRSPSRAGQRPPRDARHPAEEAAQAREQRRQARTAEAARANSTNPNEGQVAPARLPSYLVAHQQWDAIEDDQ